MRYILRGLISAVLLCGYLPSQVTAQTGSSSGPLLLAASGLEKPVGRYEPPLSPKVDLSGSRRETVSFLFKVRQHGCHTIKAKRFVSEDGQGGRFRFRFFRVDTITTRNPSFTGAYVGDHLDPVLPLRGKRYCGNKDRTDWLLAEVRIPKNRPAGRYTGTLKLARQSLKLTIDVWPMRMPKQIRLPMYAEMSPYSNLLGHFGGWTPVESDLAERYNAMLKSHNVYSLKSSIVYPQVSQFRGQPRFDIHGYPNDREAFFPVVVKNRPKSAYFDFPSTNLSSLSDAEETDYYKAMESAVHELGRPGRAMVYLWDEPYTPVYPRLLELLKKVKRYAPSVKSMVTVPAYEQFRSYIDIFCPVMNHFDESGYPSPSVYQELQQEGKEVWWYVSCLSHGCHALQDNDEPDMVIERPSAWVRSIGWLSAKYSIDAFLYYMVNVGYNRYPSRDPWDSLWEFSGNGDGTLLYPGREGERGFKKHKPVASLRLKLWRESSYDAQYVQWMQDLKRKPRWFTKKLNRLVRTPRRWSPHYSSYARLRKKIGNYLSKKSRRQRRGR